MRTRIVVVSTVAAMLAGGLAAPPAAAAEELWEVSEPVVTPVLADDPYTPVLQGPDAPGDPGSGDPSDCVISGYENRGADGTNGVRYATGCGGVLMRVTIGSDVEGIDGVARMGITATSTYGCVHARSGRTRTVLTATHRLPGLVNTYEIPVVHPPPSQLSAFSLLPLETVHCRRMERPSHLATTVSNLAVSIEPFSGGTAEVHQVPGTWTVQRPAAPRRGGHRQGVFRPS